MGSNILRQRAEYFAIELGIAYELTAAERDELASNAEAKLPSRQPLTRGEVEEMLRLPSLRRHVSAAIGKSLLAFDLSDEVEREFLNAGITQRELDEIWNAFEARTIGYIRTLNTTSITYAATYEIGFGETLAVYAPPPEGTQPSAKAADFIDPSLAAGKLGTSFRLTYAPGGKNASGKIDSYTISARPVVWKPGRRSFFSDQTARIRYTTEDRAATANDPEN